MKAKTTKTTRKKPAAKGWKPMADALARVGVRMRVTAAERKTATDIPWSEMTGAGMRPPLRDDSMADLIGDGPRTPRLAPLPTRVIPSEPVPQRRRRRRKKKLHEIVAQIQRREREIAKLKATARMLGVPVPGELSTNRPSKRADRIRLAQDSQRP